MTTTRFRWNRSSRPSAVADVFVKCVVPTSFERRPQTAADLPASLSDCRFRCRRPPASSPRKHETWNRRREPPSRSSRRGWWAAEEVRWRCCRRCGSNDNEDEDFDVEVDAAKKDRVVPRRRSPLTRRCSCGSATRRRRRPHLGRRRVSWHAPATGVSTSHSTSDRPLNASGYEYPLRPQSTTTQC